jgi:hypothetical protein
MILNPILKVINNIRGRRKHSEIIVIIFAGYLVMCVSTPILKQRKKSSRNKNNHQSFYLFSYLCPRKKKTKSVRHSKLVTGAF